MSSKWIMLSSFNLIMEQCYLHLWWYFLPQFLGQKSHVPIYSLFWCEQQRLTFFHKVFQLARTVVQDCLDSYPIIIVIIANLNKDWAYIILSVSSISIIQYYNNQQSVTSFTWWTSPTLLPISSSSSPPRRLQRNVKHIDVRF